MTRRTRREDESTAPRHNRRPNPNRRSTAEGPTPAAIGEAMHTLIEGNPKQTPKISAIKTLEDAGISFPLKVGDREIMELSITRGQTGRGSGHLRSDDHVSKYKVRFPHECPEDDCHGKTTVYEYSANHHIAGHEKEYCPMCKTVHESDQWG